MHFVDDIVATDVNFERTHNCVTTMKKKTLGLRACLVGGAMMVMGGCASFKGGDDAKAKAEPEQQVVVLSEGERYEQAMTAARAQAQQLDAESSISLYEGLAMEFPTRAEPWSLLAKARFDTRNYGEAIVAADEALKRDPSDQTAKTIRAVGGLRVAMQSLADLRTDTVLAGNARGDALALAESMRSTLGADVLFPADKSAPRKPAAPTTTTRRPAATPSAPPAAAPAKPAPNRQPDPFGSLR